MQKYRATRPVAAGHKAGLHVTKVLEGPAAVHGLHLHVKALQFDFNLLCVQLCALLICAGVAMCVCGAA